MRLIISTIFLPLAALASQVCAQEAPAESSDVQRTITCDANYNPANPGSCTVRHNGVVVELFEAETVVVAREAAERLCEAWKYDLGRRLEEVRIRTYDGSVSMTTTGSPTYSLEVLNEVTRQIGENGRVSDFCSGLEVESGG